MNVRSLRACTRVLPLRVSVIVAVAAAIVAETRASAGDRAFGEYLSGECVTCHQTSGRSTEGIPAIVAWPDDQFIAVLKSYKEKHRDNPVMQTIAGRLSDEEIAALAAYFGSLPKQATGN
jgi:cytochrome c553